MKFSRNFVIQNFLKKRVCPSTLLQIYLGDWNFNILMRLCHSNIWCQNEKFWGFGDLSSSSQSLNKPLFLVETKIWRSYLKIFIWTTFEQIVSHFRRHPPALQNGGREYLYLIRMVERMKNFEICKIANGNSKIMKNWERLKKVEL